MTVKSLYQMMRPGMVGSSGDCETCGPSDNKPTVTRVAIGNLAKLARSIPKPAPIPASQPIVFASKVVALASNADNENPQKNKGGRLKAQPKEETETEAND